MKRATWKKSLAMVPAVAVAALPKIACPACWPAYAGLLSSVGLGFLIPNTAYLLPLTVVFLVVAVGMLALRGHRRHGYMPLVLGCTSAPLIILGKFFLISNPVFYVGLGVLILASVWNSWPVAIRCACAPATDGLINLGHARRGN